MLVGLTVEERMLQREDVVALERINDSRLQMQSTTNNITTPTARLLHDKIAPQLDPCPKIQVVATKSAQEEEEEHRKTR